jgi:hypothetical protein
LAGEAEKHIRLTDEVERDVGQSDVFLEDRCVAAPLGEPMPENKAVVAVTLQVLDERGARLVVERPRSRHGQ